MDKESTETDTRITAMYDKWSFAYNTILDTVTGTNAFWKVVDLLHILSDAHGEIVEDYQHICHGYLEVCASYRKSIERCFAAITILTVLLLIVCTILIVVLQVG